MTRNALITGGSRGIGLGIAKELAKAGCNLIINGMRRREEVAEVIEALASYDIEVIYCQGDISESEGRNTLMNAAIDKFGHIHILVNNAGVSPQKRADLLNTTEESFDRVLNTNLRGPFFLSQKVAQHMIESPNSSESRCFINISSISATMASITRGEYCLSKAGMSMMTQLFATRLGEHQIPVYEIRPGIIETDMTSGVLEKYQKLIDEGLNIQSRLGSPEDVGKAVASLAMGGFPYSTGQVIMVDGGLTLPRL